MRQYGKFIIKSICLVWQIDFLIELFSKKFILCCAPIIPPYLPRS